MRLMTEREQTLLPYEPTALAGERLLVLAPHPDDDVIACGGLIALNLAERRSVTVVVATDGALSEGASPDLPARREEETRQALDLLGSGAELRFLRLPDRGLSARRDELRALVSRLIAELDPDLIAIPSLVEVHPDHAALALAAFDALASANTPSRELARVAFYEVSQPFRPNALVDISTVADAKFDAIRAHRSQIEVRAYDEFARGLNAYRAMTLPPAARYAEGYWVTPLRDLALRAPEHFAAAMSPTRAIMATREPIPTTVLVRTRNRPLLLREALASVRAQTARPQIVVVNDGGSSVADIATDDLQLIELSESVGRSEAMNVAARAAKTSQLAFLDDDDLFYAEHLATLAEHATKKPAVAHYTDAVSVFLEEKEGGALQERDRIRLYSQDYDEGLLLLDNYIPLLTLFVRREDFLDLGGFDREFDLFEDWDFLLRLSTRGSFQHIAKLTCEVRHYPASGSLIVQATSDAAKLRAGKEKIWARHGARLSHAVLSDFVERRKAATQSAAASQQSSDGRAAHLALDVERLVREKTLLIAELTEARVRSEARAEADAAERQRLEGHLRNVEDFLRNAERRVHELERHRTELEQDRSGKDELIGRLYAEIERLNALLQQIYASRAWRLHSMVERVRGSR